VIAALAALVEGRPSRGFWTCRKLLRRQGWPWNHKRIYRVYKLMKLNLRRRAKRRLPKGVRVALYVPRLPDRVRSADFMSDALAGGRRFRTFDVVDDFNREPRHIEVDTSMTSGRLVRIVERLQREHDLPQGLRTDNGPAFLGESFTNRAKLAGMAIQYIQPGKPNRNADIGRTVTNCSTNTCLVRWMMSGKLRTGGCANTTRNGPMMRWVIGHLPKPGSTLPDTPLLNCRLDGEAYGQGVTV
jgi:putative transposase